MPSRTSFSSVDRFGRNQTSHFVSKQKRKSLGFSIGPGDYGNSIISDGSGNLEWSGSIAAKQKDIYLTKESIVIPTTDVFQEFSFPLYRDGSFQFANQNQIVHVKICLYYKYKNSTSHLPFYIQIKKNSEEVYLNGYGDYDKVGDLNKLSDHLSIEANSSDTIKFYIRQKFNDPGDIEIQPFSYITYEVL